MLRLRLAAAPLSAARAAPLRAARAAPLLRALSTQQPGREETMRAKLESALKPTKVEIEDTSGERARARAASARAPSAPAASFAPRCA